ncbi:MAG: microcin ABC transporter permease, partial [Donghicola eburneus]|nr:microcin ABC transporter permease [Donghicola eburneus]
MGAYILRRLLLVIPTLIGIMIINFALVQFVPGGPVEQAIARFQGEGDVFEGIAGGGNDANVGGDTDSGYLGARGLPPEFIARLEVEYGFARIVCEDGFEGTPSIEAEECTKENIPIIERFGIMMWNYMHLDFGES